MPPPAAPAPKELAPLPEDTTVVSGPRETGLVGRISRRPSVAYRALRWLSILVLRGLLRIRLRVEGMEHLPRETVARGGIPVPGRARDRVAGGWIAAALPHRTWVDPFVLMAALPAEPRLVFFGDGRAMFRSAWRRFWVHRIGGFIPIWVRKYAPGVEREDVMATYEGSVRAVLAAGAVLAIMPETGPPAPLGEARPLGRGLAYFALRTGAPVVPVALGGTHLLFRGRTIVVRVLPPVDVASLGGPRAGEPPFEPWSAAERAAARRLTSEIQALAAPAVAEVHAAAEPPPGTRLRWTFLTRLWR